MTDLDRVAPGVFRCLGTKEQDLDVVIDRLRDEGRQPVAIVLYASMDFRREVANAARAYQRRKNVEQTSDGFLSFLFSLGQREAAHCFHMFQQNGCDYDLRGLVAQFPLDGAERREPCPRCGRTVTFRSPLEE